MTGHDVRAKALGGQRFVHNGADGSDHEAFPQYSAHFRFQIHRGCDSKQVVELHGGCEQHDVECAAHDADNGLSKRLWYSAIDVTFASRSARAECIGVFTRPYSCTAIRPFRPLRQGRDDLTPRVRFR